MTQGKQDLLHTHHYKKTLQSADFGLHFFPASTIVIPDPASYTTNPFQENSKGTCLLGFGFTPILVILES